MQFKAKKIIRDHAMLCAEKIEWFAKYKENSAFCHPPQFLWNEEPDDNVGASWVLINQIGNFCLLCMNSIQSNPTWTPQRLPSTWAARRTDSTCVLITASDHLSFCKTRFLFTLYNTLNWIVLNPGQQECISKVLVFVADLKAKETTHLSDELLTSQN